ncbi:MAG: EAL domain-containing protein [Acetobacteraceae bacterium]|jgi:EAL domain-containing protein (putative c-di-GMP-specific phosphodiesterase class I)
MPEPAVLDRSLSRERLLTFAFAAAELLVEIGPDSSITWAAGAFPARFGEPAERFVGRPLSSLIAPADRDALGRTLMNAALCGHVPPVLLRLSDAGGTPCALAALILPGVQRRLCVTLGPVPVAPPASAAVPQPASVFAKELEARLRGKQPGALALLDVKGWPAATDDASQQQRGALRDAVGEALASVAGPGTMVGEVADGRYGVLSQRQIDIAMLASGLESLMQARPDGQSLSVDSQSIGLSAPGMQPAQATRALRFALARFAASGAAAVAASGFAAGLAGFIAQTQGQTAALRQVIADRRFDVLYQPVVALRSRAVHHYEALLRPTPMAGAPWQTTQEFVTCAEALGLAEELDLAVLQHVLAALDRAPGCSIAANISGQSMESEKFRRRLLQLLPAGSYRRLLIELTETAEIVDVAIAAATLQRLREQNIGVCLDDFGAGAAAFRYLRDFPVDYLKIDGAYVLGALRGERERNVVTSMLDLARSVGAETIAEAIETRELARLMEELGCMFGQGWLFGKAAPLPGTA